MVPCCAQNGCDPIEDIHHFLVGDHVGSSCYAILVASQFCGAHGFCKNIRTCLQTICLVSIWSILKAKNDRVFNGTTISIDMLLFSINIHVWWGLKTRKQDFCYELNH
jgi:hypothetical protein